MRTCQEGPSAAPAFPEYVRPRRGPRAAQSNPNIHTGSPTSLGSIEEVHYRDFVNAARWVFEYLQSYPGGPSSCTMRRCLSSASSASSSPVPPVSKERLQGYFGSRYLQFENIRTAALKTKFTLVQVAYYRNATLVAVRAATNPERQKFIAWATTSRSVHFLKRAGLASSAADSAPARREHNLNLMTHVDDVVT
jgi:hypothetical protein